MLWYFVIGNYSWWLHVGPSNVHVAVIHFILFASKFSHKNTNLTAVYFVTDTNTQVLHWRMEYLGVSCWKTVALLNLHPKNCWTCQTVVLSNPGSIEPVDLWLYMSVLGCDRFDRFWIRQYDRFDSFTSCYVRHSIHITFNLGESGMDSSWVYPRRLTPLCFFLLFKSKFTKCENESGVSPRTSVNYHCGGRIVDLMSGSWHISPCKSFIADQLNTCHLPTSLTHSSLKKVI